jgi:hypothetical protein
MHIAAVYLRDKDLTISWDISARIWLWVVASNVICEPPKIKIEKEKTQEESVWQVSGEIGLLFGSADPRLG